MEKTVFSTLGSMTRLTILKILSTKPLNIGELQELLRQNNIRIKHRESVYRAVEKLRSANLVEKYYDVDRKSIMYKLKYKELIYNFRNGNLSFV